MYYYELAVAFIRPNLKSKSGAIPPPNFVLRFPPTFGLSFPLHFGPFLPLGGIFVKGVD